MTAAPRSILLPRSATADDRILLATRSVRGLADGAGTRQSPHSTARGPTKSARSENRLFAIADVAPSLE